MNIVGEKVKIRERRPDDSINEYVWSQDPDVTMLDPPAGKPSDKTQFSIDTFAGEHIGSCSLYDWTQTDVQLGIRIGNRQYWGQGYGADAVMLLVNHCFMNTSVERVWLKVLPQNVRAIMCYEKCGFIRTGRLSISGYEFFVMEIRRE